MIETHSNKDKTGFQPPPPQQFLNPSGGVGGNLPLNHPPSPSYYSPQMQQDPSGCGLVLALNPSQNQFLGHQSSNKRPWWMWAVAIIEIIIAIAFSARVGYNIMTADRFVSDRNTLMWAFFLIFLSLAMQFMMGVALIIGLKSPELSITLWYCQAWCCGSYFLFVETGFLLLGVIMKLDNQDEDVGSKFLLIGTKVTFRLVSFLLVRRFIGQISGKCRERAEAEERYQQYCDYQQHPHLRGQFEMSPPNYSPAMQGHHHLQQEENDQQQQCQQQPRGGNEYFYYAPQMSVLMSMMMNNSTASATN